MKSAVGEDLAGYGRGGCISTQSLDSSVGAMRRTNRVLMPIRTERSFRFEDADPDEVARWRVVGRADPSQVPLEQEPD